MNPLEFAEKLGMESFERGEFWIGPEDRKRIAIKCGHHDWHSMGFELQGSMHGAFHKGVQKAREQAKKLQPSD